MDLFRQTPWGPMVRHAQEAVMKTIYPPICVICRKSIDEAGHLCPDCWSQIHFLDGPICYQCGVPFDYPMFEDALCAACHASPPAYSRARAVFIYNDASKALVLALKHGDRTDLVPILSQWLSRKAADLRMSDSLLVPVPLHWRRRWSRQFNQSAELARGVHRTTGIDLSLFALERHVHGPSQGALTRRARQENVAGVFRVRPPETDTLEGRHVILIDDVLTTGATANACARALAKAGAGQVDVLTLARVALPNQVRI